MIKDKLEYAETYYNLSENLKKGFEWLKATDFSLLADGKYEIDGNKIYANLQSYSTKDDAPFEAHRKYIDIQYMINGTEIAEVTDYKLCSEKEPYKIENDIEFLYCNNVFSTQYLHEGEFFVFFPHDAHKPALKINNSQNVRKVIVKVEV